MSSSGSVRPKKHSGAEVEDWTEIDARKQRKRVQNRLNQKARRQRIKEIEARDSKLAQRPYRVDRWRIENRNASRPESAGPASTGEPDDAITKRQTTHQVCDATVMAVHQTRAAETFFPLPLDHMLHLVHHNVVRALCYNKNVLYQLAKLTVIDGYSESPLPGGPVICGGVFSIIQPLHRGIPNSLLPTSLQMIHPHSSWIDMFPFPHIRDNLIRQYGSFNHFDLLRDLFGGLLIANIPTTPTSPSLILNSTMVYQGEDDDVVTAGLQGLVVWGEPHEKQSWEVTPGFLKKWSWVLEGCDELIGISNGWRRSRGAQPMQVLAVP